MFDNNRAKRLLALSASTVSIVLASANVQAQTLPASNSSDATRPTSDNDIVVTGSRFGDRTATASPTPIDSIGADQLAHSGAVDLQSMLKVAVPTFSIPRPSAAGVSDFLQSPTLRGLSTGDLLLLINGKRRHTNSDLNTNNQIGRGDVAYDFSAIPASAIKRIEVLRDGAAAQYGSDAIAGVTNLVLDDSVGYLAQGEFGKTAHGDGAHYQLDLGAGFALGDGGSLRITGQYIDHHHTDRAQPDTRQQYFGSNGTKLPSGNFGSGTGLTPPNGTLDPREATFNRDIWVFGEPDYTNKTIFANFKLPVSSSVTLYSFGGYNYLRGTSYNFLRRSGQDETVRSLHPDGFLPINLVRLENYSGALGIKGDDLAGFGWDLSSVYGVSTSKQSNINSDNVSLGNASPLDFYRGAERFRQWTNNLDITRSIPMADGAPIKIAFGAEYRREWYRLIAGDPASYVNGGIPILDGPNAGKVAPVGSQPAPGITPANAISGSRDSEAIYAEIEKTFFGRLLLDGAIRHEHFSDFGNTTNYKIASRLQIAKPFAIRASYGTGFRAPALAQIIFNSSTTNFLNGQPVAIRVISVNDPIAPLVGAPLLKPEKSRDLTAGGVLKFGAFSASLDWYQLKLRDRLALSSAFSGTALTNYLTANGFPGISSVSFVTNGVDTTTRGVDITASYHHGLGGLGELAATFAANFNKSRIDRIAGTPAPLAALGITTPLEDLTNQVRLTESAPKNKIALDLTWTKDRFHLSLVNTRYGKVSQVALTNKTPAQVAVLTPGYDVTLVPAANGVNSDIIQAFRADIVTDLEASYDVTDAIRLSVGANNVFDVFPDKQIASTVASVAAGTNGADNNGVFPYAYIAPYGTSGRFLYVKASVRF
ncbi:MAG: TonB-dependent receptor [Sphingomonadaceae bacterium]|nr:TonB-dependent receptor [Sphingomonadaceae bacterium]